MRGYRFGYLPIYMRDMRFPIMMLFVFLNMYANQWKRYQYVCVKNSSNNIIKK